MKISMVKKVYTCARIVNWAAYWFIFIFYDGFLELGIEVYITKYIFFLIQIILMLL